MITLCPSSLRWTLHPILSFTVILSSPLISEIPVFLFDICLKWHLFSPDSERAGRPDEGISAPCALQ
jgi:hypothetical protein